VKPVSPCFDRIELSFVDRRRRHSMASTNHNKFILHRPPTRFIPLPSFLAFLPIPSTWSVQLFTGIILVNKNFRNFPAGMEHPTQRRRRSLDKRAICPPLGCAILIEYLNKKLKKSIEVDRRSSAHRSTRARSIRRRSSQHRFPGLL